MPIIYSQGFNPRPRLAIAAPLAIGVTSEGELMEVYLGRKASLNFFARTVNKQLPAGIQIVDVKNLWPVLPSLQSQVRFAEYRVEVGRGSREATQAVRSLLERESLPWQHARGKKIHHYDLRALIDDIWILNEDESIYTLGMRLVNDARGSGRPEQVTLALGFPEIPISIHRTRLILGSR